jgi:hypothetical protein
LGKNLNYRIEVRFKEEIRLEGKRDKGLRKRGGRNGEKPT